ncbi:MAG: DUF4935 domain-containing protein [Legionellales bacterium]|nr:DUF4935 domain-containing protein [Legionellales bacterium]
MHLFVDTNTYLSFYHMSNDDLNELDKLTALLDSEVSLWITEQVKDEFNRNRDSKIQQALSVVKEKSPKKSGLPQICKSYNEYHELKDAEKEYIKTFNALMEKIESAITDESLRADEIIDVIFKKAKTIGTTDNVIQLAKIRAVKGNPPGNTENKRKKYESMGDAINWESLLIEIPDNEDLYFITGDSDYYSSLNIGIKKPNRFLMLEWEEKKQSKIILYEKLSDFFKEHYPDIKLATELKKQIIVEKLVSSSTFSETHIQIAKLSECTGYSDEQVRVLCEAALTNSQITWILSDEDVRSFYIQILKQYRDIIDNEIAEQLSHKVYDTDESDLDE